MYACQTAKERWKTERGVVCMCVCVSLKYLFLKRVNIPPGGSEYSTSCPVSRFTPLTPKTFIHLKRSYVSLARRGCIGRGRETPSVCFFFFFPMRRASPGTFSCCEPLIDSFVLPATCNSLFPLPVEGHVAISEQLFFFPPCVYEATDAPLPPPCTPPPPLPPLPTCGSSEPACTPTCSC